MYILITKYISSLNQKTVPFVIHTRRIVTVPDNVYVIVDVESASVAANVATAVAINIIT